MAVTTRTYSLTTTRPKDVLDSLQSSLRDLGWLESNPYGYLCNFVNTPGSTLVAKANDRYLVTPTSTTAPAGNGAVFDVFRGPAGAISTVTAVTGGEGYYIRGLINVASTGANLAITVADTTGINPGMVVNKIAGTGTLNNNTTVLSVTNSSQIILDQAPSVALSGATVSFADTMKLAANTIGGNTYYVNTTGTSGATTVTAANTDNIFVGQLVSGTGIRELTTVSSISGNTITISRSLTQNITDSNTTFSDDIVVLTTGTMNIQNVYGYATGLTIANVAVNTNLYVGAEIKLDSGTPTWANSNGRVIISTITGSGPYTLTLRNDENTFKGFAVAGAITFTANPGSNTAWFDVDTFTAPQTYAWSVAKIKNSTATLGSTFWHFYVGYNTTLYNGILLYIKPMTGFNGINNLAQGVSSLDWFSSAAPTSFAGSISPPLTIASSPYVPTTLRVRQSGLDTNFATFAFLEGNNNRNPFFISKYNTAYQPWTNYNDVFLGGVFEVAQSPAYNTSDSALYFRTKVGGMPKRMAEAGYSNYNLAAAAAASYSVTAFRTNSGNRLQATPVTLYGDLALYSRQKGDIHTSVTTQYPIYKNVPICPYFFPVPYYLPEDFVLVELPWQNANIGDTITVSGSEIYTIVQSATNQSSLTGTYTTLALAARTT